MKAQNNLKSPQQRRNLLESRKKYRFGRQEAGVVEKLESAPNKKKIKTISVSNI